MSVYGLQGRCIAVIGNSGSGKSTLAHALSTQLGVKHIELDALNWGPGWRALHLEDPGRWARVVADAVAEGSWVTDGNYLKGALPCILPRASDVVWLDYSRAVIMTRVLRRSFMRALSQQELWPGLAIGRTFANGCKRITLFDGHGTPIATQTNAASRYSATLIWRMRASIGLGRPRKPDSG